MGKYTKHYFLRKCKTKFIHTYKIDACLNTERRRLMAAVVCNFLLRALFGGVNCRQKISFQAYTAPNRPVQIPPLSFVKSRGLSVVS